MNPVEQIADRAIDRCVRLDLALRGILRRYVELVDSGGCGFWDPETEEVVIAARKALDE